MKKYLDITQDNLRDRLIYEGETGLFFWRHNISNLKAGTKTGCIGVNGYVHIRLFKKLHLAHRLAWIYTYGEIPEIIDHINGVKSDNRISNLRNSNKMLNGQNRRSAQANNKTSGILGVSWIPHIKKWVAYINFSGSRTYLGFFDDKETARLAYITAKRAHHEACTI